MDVHRRWTFVSWVVSVALFAGALGGGVLLPAEAATAQGGAPAPTGGDTDVELTVGVAARTRMSRDGPVRPRQKPPAASNGMIASIGSGTMAIVPIATAPAASPVLAISAWRGKRSASSPPSRMPAALPPR